MTPIDTRALKELAGQLDDEAALPPCQAAAAIYAAVDEIESLRGVVRSIIAHWDEFGPDCGLDELLHHAKKRVAAQ